MAVKKVIMSMILLCFVIFAQHPVKGQKYPITIPSVDRLYGLSKVWQEVNYNYISLGINSGPDWDSLYMAYIPLIIKSASDYEYYRLLQRFVAHLNDGNTFVTLPRNITDSLVIPPVVVREIKGRYFVTNLDKGLAEKIPVGSEVIRINGFEISSFLRAEVLPFISANTDHARMAKALEIMLEGWVNTRVLLNCVTPDGRNINEMITRESGKKIKWLRDIPSKDPVSFKWINDDIAMVALNSFGKESIEKFPDNRQLSKAEGIIIDLRDNNNNDLPGNAATLVMRFTGMGKILLPGFTTRTYPYNFKRTGVEGLAGFGKYASVSGYSHQPPDTLTLPASSEITELPLIILTGPKTGNTAEHFLIMIKQTPFRATVIGEKTAGSTGSGITELLPGGGKLNVKSRYDIYPEDTWMLDGIEPDIYIPLDLKSILNGEDMALLKAIEILSNK